MPLRMKKEVSQNANRPKNAACLPKNQSKAVNTLLWTVQALLAALFVFAGGMKLLLPINELARQTQLSGGFIRFIGIAEVIGAVGLILPCLLRIRPRLTAAAAAGLVTIMIGATVLTLASEEPQTVVFPLVTGVLAGFVVYGRWRPAPQHARR